MEKSLTMIRSGSLAIEDDQKHSKDDFLVIEDNLDTPRSQGRQPPSTTEDSQEDNQQRSFLTPPLLEAVRKSSQDDIPDQLAASTNHEKVGLATMQLWPRTTQLTDELGYKESNDDIAFELVDRAGSKDPAQPVHEGAG